LVGKYSKDEFQGKAYLSRSLNIGIEKNDDMLL